MAEVLIYIRPVVQGDYVLDCGFECDMVGSVYYRSVDDDAFHKWFKEHMHPNGWTLTCGGPANPHCPEYDSDGHFFDRVYSMKRHFRNKKGKQGILGSYKKSTIRL